MGELGMLIPVAVALIGVFALYWARKEDVVQPEAGAQHFRADQGGVVAGDEGAGDETAATGDETAATGDEATEIEPAAGTEGGDR